jgi:hypothetical protein
MCPTHAGSGTTSTAIVEDDQLRARVSALIDQIHELKRARREEQKLCAEVLDASQEIADAILKGAPSAGIVRILATRLSHELNHYYKAKQAANEAGHLPPEKPVDVHEHCRRQLEIAISERNALRKARKGRTEKR